MQPRPPRGAGALARLVRPRQLRLGRAAGAQSLHADRGRDVPGARHHPRGRLRAARRRGIRRGRRRSRANSAPKPSRPRTGSPRRPASRPASTPARAWHGSTSPLASAALILSISSSADSREISIATRSRPPSASQMKSMHERVVELRLDRDGRNRRWRCRPASSAVRALGGADEPGLLDDVRAHECSPGRLSGRDAC